MKNNIFDFSRFSLLVKHYFNLNRKDFVRSLLILCSIPVLQFIVPFATGHTGMQPSVRVSTFVSFILIYVLFAPFTIYPTYNHPQKGLNQVLLPASVLEKFVAMQLLMLVVYPLLFSVGQIGVDALTYWMAPSVQRGTIWTEIVDMNPNLATYLFALFAIEVAFFCNLLFVRRKIIKTAGLTFIAGMLMVGIIAFILSTINWKNIAFENDFSIDLVTIPLFTIDLAMPVQFNIITMGFSLMVTAGTALLMMASYRLLRTKSY